MTAYYSEFRAYSPLHDCEVVRLSMDDGRGGEFYFMLPDRGTSKEFRAARETALDAIMEAMDMGLEPGEVRFT